MAEREARIFDLSYEPYEGPRNLSWRFWPIASAGIRHVTRSRWSKWLLASSLALTAGYGVALYAVMQFKATPLSVLMPEMARKLLRADGYVGQAVVSAGTFLGFFAALISAAPALADDLRAGGVHFHLSRPITKWDYVAGKILPTALFIGVLAGIPAVALGLLRLLLSPPAEPWYRPLWTGVQALGLAALCGLAQAVPAVALSSLSKSRTAARVAWVAFVFVFGALGGILAQVTRRSGWLALSLSEDLKAVAHALLGEPAVRPLQYPPWPVAVGALGVFVAAGLLLLAWRIQTVEQRS